MDATGCRVSIKTKVYLSLGQLPLARVSTGLQGKTLERSRAL